MRHFSALATLVATLLILSACSHAPNTPVKVWYLESATSRPVRKQEPSAVPDYPLFCTSAEHLKEILP